MSEATLTCIICPMSCTLNLTVENGKVTGVTGNECKQGPRYAEKEYTAPARSITSTVGLVGGVINRLPVKTKGEVPKDKIMDCMKEILQAEVKAPIKSGDVVISNCAGTGIDIIATRNLAAK
ncbi:MAG: DUF1667 domain-containing protein [Candidatus Saccharibacteria bacterium]